MGARTKNGLGSWCQNDVMLCIDYLIKRICPVLLRERAKKAGAPTTGSINDFRSRRRVRVLSLCSSVERGGSWSRTRVIGFAIRCLATRPIPRVVNAGRTYTCISLLGYGRVHSVGEIITFRIVLRHYRDRQESNLHLPIGCANPYATIACDWQDSNLRPSGVTPINGPRMR